MACDICGKKGTSLTDLLDQYQTDDVKSICPECEKVVNGKNSRLLTFAFKIKAALLKRFIAERRESLSK